ncbi:MAG: hypothetical protein V7749_12100 [Cocleimonas sp.]|jgi:hypothetical protein
MAQSPELAGGEGFTFEGNVTAFYLSALLAQANAPGIEDRFVVQVSTQQRDFGQPLDDVIVDFESINNNPARLSLQVKRTLVISRTRTNKDFRDIISDSWLTFKKSDFRIHEDRYGAAVDTITAAKERTLKTLCEWARESMGSEHFFSRFDDEGIASQDIHTVKDDVVALLEEAKGDQLSNEEVYQFLSHFVLIRFDFLSEGATEPSSAINNIRSCLVPDDADKASLVWTRLVQLARASAGKAGQINRTRLVRNISPVASLTGATSFRQDLDRLSELAKSYANIIQDDIGGEKLDRTGVLEDLDSKLSSARVVQIRGLPGSGKSVMIKRAVQRALNVGPVIFLKAEQLEGSSWNSFAISQGLSTVSLEALLVEIGATGTSTLFIDAIDRIEKEKQAIILDLFRVITESPLLDNWRIVVSLRDTGIEVLRNWLGIFLNHLTVDTLKISQLSDEEAEVLASSKPYMRSLLFGTSQVQEIVRRPFFAKVLSQGYITDPDSSVFSPQSEVDLIENWWRRGGYNETGQNVIERQLVLLNLASARARQLNQPISLRQLPSVAHIEELKADGILQNAREGISINFSHDIFFEWAFFHVLAERESQWIEEIRACGEPPAVARVVELISQWEYVKGKEWKTSLVHAEASNLRSQWLRSWLLAPLGTAKFEFDESQFAETVFADDFRLFKKVLVWFQAEKTSPNTSILAGAFPQEQRQRFAYLLGWPSDLSVWRRLINFILRHASDIPKKLYPEVLAVFEVWQNALAGIENPISKAMLQQSSDWLISIDEVRTFDEPNESAAFWKDIPSLNDFRNSLRQLILRSSKAEPKITSAYLQRVIDSEKISENDYRDIISNSHIVVQELPQLVVELSLKYLCKELPDDSIAREKKEFRDRIEQRNAAQAKPKDERTFNDKMILSSDNVLLHSERGFNGHEWERLSIQDDYRNFSPASALREPFKSLFQSSPDEALRLLQELTNHAMTAWRQLHRHSRNRDGIPIPLELKFPWGSQKFWGTDREYQWFRSFGAPSAIGCGFMALEEWCFSELEHGRSADQLIKQIVEGNDGIAILGVAAMIALHTETVSETSLPLFTSQRLLAADRNRMGQELSSIANLIGFDRSDKLHIECIQAANARKIRQTQLLFMLPKFIFGKGKISERACHAILNFENELPYQYEGDRDIPEAQEYLLNQALEFAELAEHQNYQAYRSEDNSELITIVHVSPSAAQPENIARREEASKFLMLSNLWAWVFKFFEDNKLGDGLTVETAICIAKEADANNLFEPTGGEGEDKIFLDKRRGAVAATAALLLHAREGVSLENLEWAREVLCRAIHLQEIPDQMWSPRSSIPWHPVIYVALGIAADLREGTANNSAACDLLGLIAHPLECVSLTAIREACKLCPSNPKLTWAALHLAFSLCHIPPRSKQQLQSHGEENHSVNGYKSKANLVIEFYESNTEWSVLPLPPPAWIKVKQGEDQRRYRSHDDYDFDDTIESSVQWTKPDVTWHSKFAAEIIKHIPFNEIFDSGARGLLLDFLIGLLEWTNQKNAPSWVKLGRRNQSSTDIYEWTHGLGSTLGKVAGLLSLCEFKVHLLDPILKLEGDNCWSLLGPFTDTYICIYVYDSKIIPEDAAVTLDLCLGRFLQSTDFKSDSYRSGKFSGFHKSDLIRTFMFVSVEHADLASRYVNGDWSDIDRILPLVDRLIRAGGWAAPVMDPFLTLCERAQDNYPADVFADQVLITLSEEINNLKGWHGTFIPARLAGMVQHFAHREAPMELALAQKLLIILDILVDMGDRRSAALQLSETFRSIRLP